MIKYSNFLFSVLVKKISLYIIFALFCLFFSGILIAQESNAEAQILFPISTFTKWFPFVFSTIFILVSVVRIFKTGEEDGTELTISAKPISRPQIILARFFVLLILIIIFHLFQFGFLFGISQIDNYATSSQKLDFAISLTIGGVIVSLIMASLIIVISSLIGRVGTVVTGILFAASIPIISFTIVPFAEAISPFDQADNDQKRIFSNIVATKKTGGVYDPSKQEAKTLSMNVIFDRDKKKFENNKNSWYNGAKYADVWYQWGRFYSLMEPKVEIKGDERFMSKKANYEIPSQKEVETFYKEVRKSTIKVYRVEYPIPNDNRIRKYVPIDEWMAFFSKDEINFERNNLKDHFNKAEYEKLTGFNGTLSSKFRAINQVVKDKVEEIKNIKLSKAKQKEKLGEFVKDKLDKIFIPVKAIPDFKYYRILLWRAIVDYQTANATNTTLNLDDLNLSFPYVWDLIYYNEVFSRLYAISLNKYKETTIENNVETKKVSAEKLSKDYFIVKNLRSEKFLETNPIIIVWSGIGAILLLSALGIYLKRDFR